MEYIVTRIRHHVGDTDVEVEVEVDVDEDEAGEEDEMEAIRESGLLGEGEALGESYSTYDGESRVTGKDREVHTIEHLMERAQERRDQAAEDAAERDVEPDEEPDLDDLDGISLWAAAYPDGDPHAESIHVATRQQADEEA